MNHLYSVIFSVQGVIFSFNPKLNEQIQIKEKQYVQLLKWDLMTSCQSQYRLCNLSKEIQIMFCGSEETHDAELFQQNVFMITNKLNLHNMM